MTKHRDSKKCAMAGCRAWAKRGHLYCASHLHSRALREDLNLLRELLAAVSLAPDPASLQELELIDAELRYLQAARATFLYLLRGLGGEDPPKGRPAVNPTQFLRAWNDSTARLLQLLRVRRELTANREGEFGPVIEAAYRLLEEEDRESEGSLGA